MTTIEKAPTNAPDVATTLSNILKYSSQARDAQRVLQAVVYDVSATKTGEIDKATQIEWTDISSHVENNVKSSENAWVEQAKGKGIDQNSSAMYAMALTNAWDFSECITLLSKSDRDALAGAEISRMLDVLFGSFTAKLYHQYIKPAPGSNAGPRSRYVERTPVPGSIDFAYPGFHMHLAGNNENAYYHKSIPYGRIIAIVKQFIAAGNLPPLRGGTFLAAIAYSWYEMTMSCMLYCHALNQYRMAMFYADPASSPYVEDTTYAFANAYVSDAPAQPGTNPPKWVTLIKTGRNSMYEACSTYVESCLKRGGAGKDILSTLDAKELASDPSKLSGILKNAFNIDITPEMMRSIPGVSDIFGSLLGGGGGAAAASS